ncbi:MAG: acetyltransferase [Ginsengibacter sp.]
MLQENNPYGIYGASGHGKVIIEILESSGNQIKWVYDDDENKKEIIGYDIEHAKEVLKQPDSQWIIAVGDNATRRKIAFANSIIFGKAVHINSNISKRVHVGDGTVIMAGVAVNSSTRIGEHVIINTNSSIDHDCEIGDFVHVSPNATLCGGVSVGEVTHIGAGAVIIPGIRIGKWAKIGAGAVIIRDVPDFSTVVGNPGRKIKKGENE